MSKREPANQTHHSNGHTATAEPEPINDSGRDGRGRFTKGNKCSKGNPFAGQVARLRKAALEVVTPEDMQSVFRVLLLRAQTGHLASMQLLFAYTIGKPVKTVDPDEVLDEEEL